MDGNVKTARVRSPWLSTRILMRIDTTMITVTWDGEDVWRFVALSKQQAAAHLAAINVRLLPAGHRRGYRDKDCIRVRFPGGMTIIHKQTPKYQGSFVQIATQTNPAGENG